MKKNVILVNSTFNLILAIQLRKKLYPNEYFDLVLSDQAKGLYELYEEQGLKNVFDNVFYARTEAVRGRKGKNICLKALIKPVVALNKMMEVDFDADYTDVFCWNPDPVFYYLIMELNKNKKNFALHLYTDSQGGYMTEDPIERGEGRANIYDYYKLSWTHRFLQKRYGVKPISKMDYDFYLFSPEMGVNSGRRKYVEIPPIECNQETKDTFNQIFKGDIEGIAGYKYILFAQPIKDFVDNTDFYEDLITSVVKKVGAEKFVVKIHPRCTEEENEMYRRIGITIVQGSYPWELYCLNHDTSGVTYLTIASSAVIMPHLLFKQDNKTIMLYGMLDVKLQGIFEGFYVKFGDYLSIPKNKEELLECID